MEEQVRDDRHVVATANLGSAVHAGGTRRHHRTAQRQSSCDNIEKAPGCESGSNRDGCERGVHSPTIGTYARRLEPQVQELAVAVVGNAFRSVIVTETDVASAERPVVFTARSTWSCGNGPTGATHENGEPEVMPLTNG